MANTKGRNGRRRGRPSLIYGEYEGEEWKEERKRPSLRYGEYEGEEWEEERKTKLEIWRIRRGGMEGVEEDQVKDIGNNKGRNGRRRGRDQACDMAKTKGRNGRREDYQA